MNVPMTVYVGLLFYVLLPGVLVSLPRKGSKMIVALTHAVIFALVLQLTYKLVWKLVSQYGMDGFQDASGAKPPTSSTTTTTSRVKQDAGTSGGKAAAAGQKAKAAAN